MKKEILMIVLLSSISFAGSYKIGNMYFHEDGTRSISGGGVYDRLEHKRFTDRRLSAYFRKKNNIIIAELEKKKREKRKNASISSLLK